MPERSSQQQISLEIQDQTQSHGLYVEIFLLNAPPMFSIISSVANDDPHFEFSVWINLEIPKE